MHFFLAACLGFAGLALPDTAPAGAPTAPEWSGHVYDRAAFADPSDAGQVAGLAGATVTVRTSDGKTAGQTRTDKQGSFRLRGLKPGHYAVIVSHPGYLPNPLVRPMAWFDDQGGRYASPEAGFVLDIRDARAKPGAKASAAPTSWKRWAEGWIAAAHAPELWKRDARDTSTTLGRFFDATDTSQAYRSLWYGLLWLETEGQAREVVTRVRMAQALDSLLSSEAIGPALDLTGLAPYRGIAPDSLQRYAVALRALALGQPLPSANPRMGRKTEKRPRPLQAEELKVLAKGWGVPKNLALELALEAAQAASLPAPKRKALVAKIRGFFSAEGQRELLAALNPTASKPAKGAKPGKGRKPALSPSSAKTAEWPVFTPPRAPDIVAWLAATLKHDPTHAPALLHQGWRLLDQGKPREALARFDRALESRPGYPIALRLTAKASLSLGDTTRARQAYDALIASEAVETKAEGYRGQGALLAAAGRLEEAEQSYRRAMGFDPVSPEAQEGLLALAELALQRGEPEAYETLLDTLAQKRPRDARPHFVLGRIALKRGQDGVAAERFAQALLLAPRETHYAEALAKVQAERDEWPAALKTLTPYKSRLSVDGHGLYADALLHSGKPADAVRESEKVYGRSPTALALTRWAQALTAGGAPLKAIDLIRQSPFVDDPAQTGVKTELARALIEADQGEEARRLLTPLVDERGTDADLQLLLGRCFFSSREFAKASDAFGQALRYRQDFPEALYRQGLSMIRLGRAEESHHYFSELTERDNRMWRAKGFLGRGEAFAQEDKPEAAEEYLRRSMALLPSAEASAHLALVMLKAGKKSEAEGWAKKAHAADRGLALATAALVDVYLETGREEEALALAEDELENHPGSCEHLVMVAKANYQAGLDDRAREISETALKSCAKDPGPPFYLGALAVRAGDKAKARAAFDDYLMRGGDIRNLPRSYR